MKYAAILGPPCEPEQAILFTADEARASAFIRTTVPRETWRPYDPATSAGALVEAARAELVAAGAALAAANLAGRSAFDERARFLCAEATLADEVSRLPLG